MADLCGTGRANTRRAHQATHHFGAAIKRLLKAQRCGLAARSGRCDQVRAWQQGIARRQDRVGACRDLAIGAQGDLLTQAQGIAHRRVLRNGAGLKNGLVTGCVGAGRWQHSERAFGGAHKVVFGAPGAWHELPGHEVAAAIEVHLGFGTDRDGLARCIQGDRFFRGRGNFFAVVAPLCAAAAGFAIGHQHAFTRHRGLTVVTQGDAFGGVQRDGPERGLEHAVLVNGLGVDGQSAACGQRRHRRTALAFNQHSMVRRVQGVLRGRGGHHLLGTPCHIALGVQAADQGVGAGQDTTQAQLGVRLGCELANALQGLAAKQFDKTALQIQLAWPTQRGQQTLGHVGGHLATAHLQGAASLEIGLATRTDLHDRGVDAQMARHVQRHIALGFNLVQGRQVGVGETPIADGLGGHRGGAFGQSQVGDGVVLQDQVPQDGRPG